MLAFGEFARRNGFSLLGASLVGGGVALACEAWTPVGVGREIPMDAMSGICGARPDLEPGPTCALAQSQPTGTQWCEGLSAIPCPNSECNGVDCATGCNVRFVLTAGSGYVYTLKAVANPNCALIGSTHDEGACNAACECKITRPGVACPATPAGMPNPAIIRCS